MICNTFSDFYYLVLKKLYVLYTTLTFWAVSVNTSHYYKYKVKMALRNLGVHTLVFRVTVDFFHSSKLKVIFFFATALVLFFTTF